MIGMSPLEVSLSTCYFCKVDSSWIAPMDFLTLATNALALFSSKSNYEKIPYWNMKVAVGNKSWVHYAMASKISTPQHIYGQYRHARNYIHFSPTTRGSFMQLYKEKDSTPDLSGAYCNNAGLACARLTP